MQHGVLVPLVEVGEVLPGPNNSIRNNANPTTSFQHACSTDKALPIDGQAVRYRVLVLMKPWVHAKHDFSWEQWEGADEIDIDGQKEVGG